MKKQNMGSGFKGQGAEIKGQKCWDVYPVELLY
jgi:hypothetical protein